MAWNPLPSEAEDGRRTGGQIKEMEMVADKMGPGGPETSGCPAEELLARFSMNELSPDTPEARHIARCPECRRRLEALNEALRLWEKEHAVPCDAAVLERIRRGFHRKLHENGPGF